MSRVVRAIFLFLLAAPCCAFAQDAARVEVFGGYQYFHANSGFDVPGIDSFSMNGWNAAVSGFLNKHLGATADFAGVYGTPSVSGIGVDTKLYTFLFGPVVRVPNSTRITPFAHALFGGGHASASVMGFGGSETDFTWAAGGGLDFGLSHRFAIRPVQADFLQTRVGGESQNNFRYSAGVVFKF